MTEDNLHNPICFTPNDLVILEKAVSSYIEETNSVKDLLASKSILKKLKGVDRA